MDFDVESIGGAAIDERRPEPVVDVLVGYVTHHIAAPIDTLVVVRE